MSHHPITIHVKKVEGIALPSRKSTKAAAWDIYATTDGKIVGNPNGTYWDRIDYIEFETGLYISPQPVGTPMWGRWDQEYHTILTPRSSVSEYNLVLANSQGTIDMDYTGQLLCRFKYIWQPEDFSVQYETLQVREFQVKQPTGKILGKPNLDKIYKKGDRIIQLKICETIDAKFELVENLESTDRGSGGFGSTGR